MIGELREARISSKKAQKRDWRNSVLCGIQIDKLGLSCGPMSQDMVTVYGYMGRVFGLDDVFLGDGE